MDSHLDVEVLSPLLILLDVFIICLSLVSTPILTNHFKPFRSGFFCDDDTIRYPYKTSTVNDEYLYSFSVGISVLTISGLELWLTNRNESLRRARVLISGRAVPAWIVRWVRHVLLYGLGLGCHEWIVNLGKFTVGRLRPHFLDVCNPNVLCNATGQDPHAYITDYVCANAEGFAADQSSFSFRLSFPSGHSSISFYGAIFTVLYIEKRVNWPDRLMVVKTAVQTIVFALAWYTALSRIQDHKHHWGDVVTGSMIGTVFAIFWVFRVLRVKTDSYENSISSEATYVFPSPANLEK